MIEIKHDVPSIEDYRRLREASGLSGKSEAAARKGLPNSCFAVTIYEDGYAIGMGRVIGDGGTAFQIIDIAVDKKWQKQGHGRTIMTHIMDYITSVAEPSAYVSLIADYPADKLYEKFGFIPTEPYSAGMYQKY